MFIKIGDYTVAEDNIFGYFNGGDYFIVLQLSVSGQIIERRISFTSMSDRDSMIVALDKYFEVEHINY